MVKLEIKREWMVLLVVALSFLAVSFVVSQSSPSVLGHSANEIGSGTINADVTFGKKIYSTTNDADFLSVTNTNPSQNHIAIISNKEDFGIYSTLGHWADFSARDINARGISAEAIYASDLLINGEKVIKAKHYVKGSQEVIFTPTNPWYIDTLAKYADIYTGGSDRRGFQGYKGCLRGITEYCQNQGYLTASVLSTTCGKNFDGDASCPNVPGCNIDFFCLKL